MTVVTVQESLLDLADDPAPGPLRPERVPLAHGAWVDVQRGWLAGSGALFARLAERVPWRAERRRMYDRTVDVPRLLCFYGEDADLPDSVLAACRDRLSEHYQAELGESFRTAGTASRGTETPSGAEAPRTQWSRSCRWAPRARCCSGRGPAPALAAMTAR